MPSTPRLPPADELEPVGRYEWERIVRRLIVPPKLKLFALLLGTFADADGTRVRPGNDILGYVSKSSESTTKRMLAVLRHDGLIELVSRGGGRHGQGRASEYRLTIPPDLMDRFDLLGPDCRPLDSQTTQVSPQSDPHLGTTPLREVTQMTPECGQSPVDNSADEASGTSMRAHSEGLEGSPGRPTTSHRPTKRSSGRLPAQPQTARDALTLVPAQRRCEQHPAPPLDEAPDAMASCTDCREVVLIAAPLTVLAGAIP